MIIKKYKNHILFEPGKNESLSKLGMKATYRQNDKILLIRKICKNGRLGIICDIEGYDKLELDKNLSEYEIAMFFKALAELLYVCDESAFLDHTYVDASGDLFFYREISGEYRFALIPVDSADYAGQQKIWDENVRKWTRRILEGREICSSSLKAFMDGLETTLNIVGYIKEKAFDIQIAEKTEKHSDGNLELEYNGMYGSFTLYVCKDEFIIGKATDCDGVLSMNPTISRHHCRLQKIDGRWTIEDLGSSNGTAVGASYLMPEQKTFLTNNERIHISDMEFWVKISDGI